MAIDRSDELLIIRPTVRCLFGQMALLVACGGAAFAFGYFFLEDPAGLYFAFGTVGIVALGGQIWAFRSAVVKALVATPTFLGVLYGGGVRRYIPWDSVRVAGHSTGLFGRRWSLKFEGGRVTIRDLGVPTERWGLLWRIVERRVAQSGGRVWVDAISNTQYG
jgi:hypothetical protein